MSAIKANQVLNLDGDRIGSVVVDSIANMKNLNTEIEANATVELLGYYSKGDGGGGTFYWDSTSIEDDNGGTIIQATGVVDGRWIRNYSGAVNVKWFGAVDGGDDCTDAVNAAAEAAKDYGDYTEKRIEIIGEKYTILGTVYLRLGQSLYGEGTRLYMGATGSIKVGYNSSGVKDSGGHPPYIDGFWIEGGYNPINCAVSGYFITRCFFSVPVAPCIFSGSDGVVDNCVFDNGSVAVSFGGSNTTMSNCIFYVCVTQLQFTDCNNSVISNCVFNYASEASVKFGNLSGATKYINNLRFDNCSFKLNTHGASFKGFIYTLNSAIEGNVYFTGCSFINAKDACVNITGTSSLLELYFNDCVFDGEKSRDNEAQSTTAYAVNYSGSGKNKVYISGSIIKNMRDTPVQTSTNEAYELSLKDITFKDNAGTEDINLAGTNGSAIVNIQDIQGSGKTLLVDNGNQETFIKGHLVDCMTKVTSGGREYWELPFENSTLIKLTVSLNRNPAGSTLYRRSAVYYVSIGYDYSGGTLTQGTISSVFESTSPLGGTLDTQLDINTLGNGLTITGTAEKGKMIISTPEGYGYQIFDVKYELYNA